MAILDICVRMYYSIKIPKISVLISGVYHFITNSIFHPKIYCAIFFVWFALVPAMTYGLTGEKVKVMVMEIKGEIDPRMSRYVRLALAHAKAIATDIVIIDMDTYGGVLTDAKDIVDIILDLDIPIWVFINKDAASAGALISIACDSIYMAPGSNIGAATVVSIDGKAAPDKYQSYMRAIMRATAEESGRNPDIAEAMVDEQLIVKGLTKAGEVITFTTSEALKHGYCEASVGSIDAVLERNHVNDYEIVTFTLSTSEKIIAFFISPFISGILILLILGGLYFELQSPGIGFPLVASIIALFLYLVPYYLNGLAENWEIIILFIGIILMCVEIFIIPGFGAAGVSGIGLSITSLILIMLDNDFFNFERVPTGDITIVFLSVFGGIVGGIIFIILWGTNISNTRFFRHVSLTATQDVSKGYTVNIYTDQLVGKIGVSYTVLRPGGKIILENQLYDAFSYGDYIDKGQSVQVFEIEGTTLKVKRSST